MARSKTWYVKLPTVFPKDRPIARLIARLFVLWQDLLYEKAGIAQDEGFEGLDRKGTGERGELHRRLYFIRANSRTLVSAKYLFDALVADPTFAGWLKEDARLSATFFAAKKSFDRHREVVERVRNTVGAHAEHHLGDAIDSFVSDDEAPFEIHSDDFIRPHLATEILLAALTPSVPEEERLEAYKAVVTPLAEATNAMIAAMATVVEAYMVRLRLLPE